ncbi:hypothetical protein OHA40_04880 [Nocardia sp. NBC_00508]|uniref:hypothetical protein n=1 Tax=Nocardia sp. NBC_00508 TaxID=2975992 RepID=UPI002E81D4BD|nr:hypothetical protein [Nocardia sp. NBC_00508]WUD67483.1 hypothetical protein OHA40_04880 [Nocardia sp. NBC_00508]
MTTTVHVDDTVRDYDSWKTMFDSYEKFRADAGARNCRVERFLHNPNRVLIDLDFDTAAAAEAFRDDLRKIIDSPRVQGTLVSHEVSILELVDEHHPSSLRASK